MGDVILRIYHSHNIPLGYDVLRIRIISNTCSAVQYYGIGAPNIKEAEKRGTIRGTKVLNRYRQRIDDSYNKIINSIDSTSRNFTNVDEESFNYTIEVNPRLQKSIDSAVSDYTVPK